MYLVPDTIHNHSFLMPREPDAHCLDTVRLRILLVLPDTVILPAMDAADEEVRRAVFTTSHAPNVPIELEQGRPAMLL